MRFLAVAFAVLITLIQYPLWLGKGGWLRVWELDRQLSAAKARNDGLQARNDAVAAEVLDLKEGVDALEERARYELGMVKADEIFFQLVDPSSVPPPAPVKR